ncbi:MAG TPA: hypothetical protein EYN57_09070 [Candidatus Lambdaproteobacteria bacterium]|jgi:hypothetical protein|nr:hypothetical protein [SAR324 cluster bacterium]HHZ79069.1 hypothetical protein [Candidatus Lambdaproteobacteria bacterium]HIO61017.1 hypothetical protein [Deltaproteobacteria bacterium]
MKQTVWKILIITGFCFCFFTATAFSITFERRQDQFDKTPGLFVVPAPYAIPGIGNGLFVIGYLGNIAETSADVFGMGFVGDGQGFFASVDELFVFPEWSYLALTQGRMARFGQNVYSSRGMKSEKNDFNIYVGEDFTFYNFEVVFTHFERRIELAYGFNGGNGKFVEIKDYEGELVQKLGSPIEVDFAQKHVQLKIDLTDDYGDPRDGLNIRILRDRFPSVNQGAAFDSMTFALTYYLPIPENNTWAFHYFRSDAHVRQEGNTDLESLKTTQGFYACGGYAACEAATLKSAQNRLNANKNGSSKSLGGADRLRSYPLSRYQAAHTLFYGTELRWNFSTENTKLDYWLLQDVQQALQAVFFWEQGSVAEEVGEIGETIRSSYGTGIRLVTKSGSVYKFEVASGDEGAEMILFFEYPWIGLFGS